MNDTNNDDSIDLSPSPEDTDVHPVDPGTAPEEVYERIMSPWRAKTRRWIMRNLQAETDLIARMQRHIRTPWLDTYFVYTSSLGTHTFFLTGLPMVFFFGFLEVGRGYVRAIFLELNCLLIPRVAWCLYLVWAYTSPPTSRIWSVFLGLTHLP